MSWEKDRLKIVSANQKCIEANNLELFSRLKNKLEEASDIIQIVRFIIDRSSAVWVLTLGGRLWDAEIINRSVLEALSKLMFIVQAPSEIEKETRVQEFWNDLFEINALRRSEHSKEMIEQFDNQNVRLAHLSLILDDEREKYLKDKWNRKDRKKLAQKWSFSEIISCLMKDYNGKEAPMFTGLFHEYRMASHVTHGDETGIGIIEERESRPAAERAIVERAHFVKLIGSCAAFSAWTATTVMEFLGKEKDFFIENHRKTVEANKLAETYGAEVFEDSDYDKHR